MENYCKITSCLRKYILDYFGEKTQEACDNCGNCHRKYQEVDMTAQAKWVMNCVYETRGRYGLNIVLGTLLGANRARLREVGAVQYKSYGSLSEYSEAMVRQLISEMIQDGYLRQTDDKYSVLQMGPEMDRLRDENTRVIVRMYEEKEPAENRKKYASTRKTDALTSAGFELFEKLRSLRYEIAKESSLPPYIIFSDKTLIDMCVKLPYSREEMLNVNGVGENKFTKYGQLFLDEIKNYTDKHPDAVISEPADATDKEIFMTVKNKKHKKEFYITPEQADNFQYGEMYYISEIKDHLNMICEDAFIKKASTAVIWDFLVKEGLTFEENRDGVFVKTKTDKGSAAGIEIVHKISKAGLPYELLRYPENVQRLIVNYFVK